MIYFLNQNNYLEENNVFRQKLLFFEWHEQEKYA